MKNNKIGVKQEEKKNLLYNTYINYDKNIRLHIKPFIGSYRLRALEPDVIQKWIDDIKLKGLAITTTKNILACLSCAMNYAVMPLRYIKYNPCEISCQHNAGSFAGISYLKFLSWASRSF